MVEKLILQPIAGMELPNIGSHLKVVGKEEGKIVVEVQEVKGLRARRFGDVFPGFESKKRNKPGYGRISVSKEITEKDFKEAEDSFFKDM